MIMTRKNLILLLFSLLTLNSCNKHEGPELRFCENYIQNYCQGDLVLLSRSPDRPPQIPADPQTPIRNFWIKLTDCEWISPESDPQEFERLAIRNGDVGYNRWLEFWEYPSAFADNFQTMHITSNADWDEEHPAGTLLDDILWAEFWSYADYIRSGYETGGGNNVQMLVEDLKADDMQMIRDYVIIYFTKTPTIDPIHTLTVEWTTVEGEVKTASLTCRPQVNAKE